MRGRERRALEKRLLAMLGRAPWAFGLVPAPGGWFSIREVHRALLQEAGLPRPTLQGLKQFFALHRPRSLEWTEDRVRARPEFQVEGLGTFPEAAPPESLYTAIRPGALSRVREHGLRAPRGGWVVLSAETETARCIGRRRVDAPVVARVRAGRAAAAGVRFRAAGEGLFVAEAVPPEWVELPPPGRKPREKAGERPRDGARPAGRAELPGGYRPGPEVLPAPGRPRRRDGRRKRGPRQKMGENPFHSGCLEL
ncbi:hypothetical protein G3N55_01740 [Dissulfurirhabdus thermomarina]|uniref:RNA 2'-phosphotransferase n=1 Tax=Dissulfurirhabdus thermomarina TaxID=1765737 RepID=A0A6N9TPB2_DISTH|nr:hypothetical protein [Dissulfurirhabdus thermomarina]NDY41574.1 hypothetical protein [Dissulfurirhabdus thermomarina]NMX22371.1 hypothetical protein [Dissulfurirhabdus thermomarina]